MKYLINKSLPYFISKRIAKDTLDSKESKATIIMTRVAMLSVAISIIVILIAISIVSGFSNEIDSKVKGILSNYQIVRYDNNFSSEKGFIERNDIIIDKIKEIDFIENVSAFALKNGIAKNSGEITGILIKGVEDNSKIEFYEKYLISGRLPIINEKKREKEIIISASLAKHLKLKSGDMLELMFVEDPPLRERYKVTGIYDTSLSTLDKMLAITDLRNVQDIHNWSESKVSGYDITIEKGNNVEKCYNIIADIVDNTEISNRFMSTMLVDIKANNPQIYSWLDLQKSNELVIITIMLIVAAINIISMVLIIILQKLHLMGVLTVIGMSNSNIRRILIYRSLSVVLKAMLIGNAVALFLLFVQKEFKIIKLDGDGYFLNSVPVYFEWDKILIINILTIVIMLFFQFITTLVISKFTPSKIVKYEKR